MQPFSLTFLEANVPLVKTIRFDGKALHKTNYPMVSKFTSHTYTVKGIEEFRELLIAHALQGHCLLKGTLRRPLLNESRRSSTQTNDTTSWVCLDFDKLNGHTVKTAMKKLGLEQQQYLVQYSASQSLPGTPDNQLNAHVFFLLEEPVPAPNLKAWLMKLNLDHFQDELRLNNTNMNLTWPLDITTCQNDKLIFIAPPTFVGMKDPVRTRIL